MKHTLTLMALAAGLLSADTQRLDLPAGGALHLKHSGGELDIEGWDRPDVEITTDAHITSERNGNELVVSMGVPKRGRWAWLFARPSATAPRYEIKAPRNARLIIEHDTGGVFIDSMASDVDASVRDGQITLRLPETAQFSIDAKSKIGSVVSDFAGHDHRQHLFGHQFTGDASQTPQKLHLRVGYGDIVVLKIQQPK